MKKPFPWYYCFGLAISQRCVNQITWPRGRSCSQENFLFLTPPRLSVIPTVFGGALRAPPLRLVWKGFLESLSIWELQMFQISPSFQYPFSPYNMFWSHQSHSWPHALPHLYGLWIYLWSYHCLLTFQFWLKPLGRREDNLDPQTQAQVWHWHHYICVIECLINT